MGRYKRIHLVFVLFLMSSLVSLAQFHFHWKIEARVQNIIILISDGCGYNHIDAASYFQHGRANSQVYEHFPVSIGMSTFMYKSKNPPVLGSYEPASAWSDFWYVTTGATDSAAAATTMSTGFKTYGGAIGVDVDENPLMHLMDYAESIGKATGVVTSVEWTHATPAGFVAHNVSRNNYAEIGKEMVYDSWTDVIMGCGHPWYDRDGIPKATPNTFKFVGGEQTWLDLEAGVAGGDADGDGLDDSWTLIQTREEFRALMAGPTPKRVLATAQVYQTLQQGRAADPLIPSVPTLEEMTKAALNILDNDGDGFVLMVEGGAVDWASHANQGGRMIEEEIDFNRSVEAVVDWVESQSNWDETLVIVTGDHETGYLCGPGSAASGSMKPIVNNGIGVQPGMEWNSGYHTNSLILFFAKGSLSHLFEARASNKDPIWGNYIDNREVAIVIFQLLGYFDSKFHQTYRQNKGNLIIRE
jgi:alkaline phosphatase